MRRKYFADMNASKTIMIALFVVFGVRLGLFADAGRSAWDEAIDPVKKERFIPVELWTGAEWDGAKELKISSAAIRFGDREHKEIKGPTEWKHPFTGETLLVYERTNQDQQGAVKLEYFAMNESKTGLGRVYDSRKELGTRIFSGGLKFPLGYWKEGDTKQFVERRYGGNRVETRTESITITKLDFTHNGAPHCLEFEWLYRDGAGKTVDYQTYTYCPNQAMVRQVQHR